MLSSRRTSIEDSEPAVLRNNGLSPTHRYPSTPHLDAFLVSNSASTDESNGIITTNNYMKTPLNTTPKLSTFSTFSHHKSGADLRYRDDPNPYKVSDIDEFRIQTQDPYKTKSTHQLNAVNQIRSSSKNGVIPYYDHEVEGELTHNGDSPLSSPGNDYSSRSATGLSRLSSTTIRSFSSTQYENDSLKKFYPGSEASQNSGEYEIPDPDYEDADGSTGGSSEELPLPPPLPHIGDSSEEYSQLSISASSNSGGLSTSPIRLHDNECRSEGTPIKISDVDRHRIQRALQGRKTQVFVTDVLANLYYKNKPPTSTPAQRPQASKRLSQNDGWELKHTGVPVLLFDTGETKSRDKRKIQIVLAELSSGLALWKDVVDNLSNYHIVEGDSGRIQAPDGTSRPVSTFHTMHMSSDHTRVVGLSFDNAQSADKFALKMDKLTSDFANISLSGAKSKAKKEAKLHEKNKAEAAKRYVRPKKSDISQPCCFQHVSSLSTSDKTLYATLQQFLSPKMSSGNGSLASNSPDISF